MAPTGHVELAELDVDAQGNFELIVSAREHTGNWLPMSANSDNILVRQTFRDRRREKKAELQIECLNPAGSDDLSPAEFSASLSSVVPFITGTAGLFTVDGSIRAAH